MAIGNPLLATWAGDTLVRTYELSGGILVPLGVSDEYPHLVSPAATETGNIYPGFEWYRDDNYLLFEHNPISADGQLWFRVLNNQGTLVYTNASFGGTGLGGGIWVKDRRTNSLLYRASTPETFEVSAVRVNAGGSTTDTGATQGGNENTSSVESFVMSPNGMFFIMCGHDADDGALEYENVATPLVWPPELGPATAIPLDIDAELVVISGDNNTCCFLSKDDRKGVVYQRNSGDWDKMHDLPLPDVSVGVIHSAVGSPDGIYMAVVFRNGTVYTTRIYKRIAGYMTLIQDIETFGRAIAFTVDGVVLIDGFAKLGYKRNDSTGDFDEQVGMATGLASGIVKAVFSDAPVYPVGVATVYRSVLQALAEGTIEFEDLKFTLLKPTAPGFEQDETDIANIIGGGNEVTGGGWPAGGYTLQNVDAGLDGDVWEITADDVDWVTFGAPMTYRYGVVYDEASGRPIMFYDFLGSRTIASNRSFILTFPQGVVVRISR